MNTSVMFSSKTDQHATPGAFFDELNKEFSFGIDVCADATNAKCEVFFDKQRDGLSMPWAAEARFMRDCGWPGLPAVWMNPPYGDPEFACKTNCKKKRCVKRGHHNAEYRPGICDWVKKAYEESLKGVTVVCLLPSRTDTKWFQDYCLKGDCRFVRGRLKFGDAKNSAPFPSVVVVFRPASTGSSR